MRALHRDVIRYVAHLCADPQAVDDLAQDTFLRAFGSLHRFAPGLQPLVESRTRSEAGRSAVGPEEPLTS